MEDFDYKKYNMYDICINKCIIIIRISNISRNFYEYFVNESVIFDTSFETRIKGIILNNLIERYQSYFLNSIL